MTGTRSGRASEINDPSRPRPFGSGPIARRVCVVDADRDERRQAAAGLVEDAQRAVTGVDERRRRLHDVRQRPVEVELRPDRQDSVQQLSKAARTEVIDAHLAKRTHGTSVTQQASRWW